MGSEMCIRDRPHVLPKVIGAENAEVALILVCNVLPAVLGKHLEQFGIRPDLPTHLVNLALLARLQQETCSPATDPGNK